MQDDFFDEMNNEGKTKLYFILFIQRAQYTKKCKRYPRYPNRRKSLIKFTLTIK